ncbi:murein biosynthesis integral membrane protein MurJ [Clostridium sp.]|uniref:murein biosynthesis integral membrane protein MurJ n=1 Tax=Clostridium sp. TaxID=1506 RepID=UPI001A5D62E8|nr:murein biosynthesis integral membrane protein MurJ [Clostridium sp.]MBK5234112.1 murein biosynthesis integral membrane protein MurJ [Clostridium sp.]
MSTKIKNVAKYSAMIAMILILSKLIGTVREFIIAAQFGASIESDIFKTATRIPYIFYGCVGAALTTSFIPAFSKVKDDIKEANEFFNNILNILFVLCFILTLLGIVFSTELTQTMASGFNSEAIAKTVFMTKIAMPSIIFLALSGLYTGYLQSYGIFLQPALTGIVSSIVVIVGILVFYKYGIIAAVIAFLISSVAQMMIQRPFMPNYKYKMYINLKDENVRGMLKLAIPTLISTAVNQINVIVASDYASRLGAGSISVVDYASKLSTLISQVFIVSITTVFYPMLTERFAQNDHEGFKNLFIKSVNVVILIAVPLVFGLAALSTPIVKLTLGHGKFDTAATVSTALCLKYLAFSGLGYSLIDILSKVFYSTRNTVTPMINGFVLIILNIILIVLLAPKYGVVGLALASTISVTIMAIIMAVELKFKLKNIKFRKIETVFIKSLIAGIFMMIVVTISNKGVNIIIPRDSTVLLAAKILIVTVIGAICYTLSLAILKVKELEFILSFKALKKR